MKYIKHLLALIVFFSLIITVQAKDITLKDIYDNLKNEESNINDTNDIYISSITYTNNKINISYEFKDNISKSNYLDPQAFITTITGDDIVTFLSGMDNIYLNIINSDDYVAGGESDSFDNFNKTNDLSKIIAIDNAWFEKLVAVLNSLTNNKFAKFNEIKKENNYCDRIMGMCYVNSECGIEMPYFKAKFRVNKNLIEIENITTNNIKLKFFDVGVDNHCSVLQPLALYQADSDWVGIQNNEYTITDLLPNTKYTYYVTVMSYENENKPKEFFEELVNKQEAMKLEFTTLEEPKTNDTQETNKPNDNQEIENPNTGQETNRPNNNQEIENPNTGAEIPIITIIVLLSLSIILFKVAKKNKKLSGI